MNRPVVSDLQLGVPVTGDRRSFLRQLAAAGWASTGGAAVAAPARRDSAAALRRAVRGTVVAQGDAAWPDWVQGMV